MVKIWESIFGHQIKPDGPGQVHYLGGHKKYPSHSYSHVYFYEDRFELQPYKLKIYYKSIKNIENTSKKKRDSEYLATGLIAPPVALGYLWKKNHIYTIIEYDAGVDIQKIVLDFDNNANYAQGLIYKKMLEFRG